MSAYRPPRRSYRETPYLNREYDVGLRQHTISAQEAELASRELLERIESSIFKFGFKYGISSDEARHLLLNTGVRL
jgi:hypothetical protein